MSKYHVLIYIPVLFGLFHLFAWFAWGLQAWFSQFVYLEIIVVKSLSFVGFLIAARSFESGDRMHRGWMFMAWSILMHDLNDILSRSLIPGLLGDDLAIWFRALLLVLGNLFMIIGAWILARTWVSSGLSYVGSGLRKHGLVFGSIFLSLGLAGPAVLQGTQEVLSGTPTIWSVISIISGMGDTVALSLIGPTMLTALTLSGSLLRWPWTFLSLILFSWLLTDGMLSWGPVVGLSEQLTRNSFEFFRILACMFGLSAGLAQRMALRDIQSRATGMRTAT